LHGWHGRVLHVDLSDSRVWNEKFDVDFAKKFLGARGINAKLLLDLVPRPGINPFGPENPLIFGVGPLTGTNAPTSGRSTVTFVSPATGMYGKSNAGGHFGGELKYAGYDNLVIQGASDKPVYLWICDDKVELRDASHLWGRTVEETDTVVKKELQDRDIRVACIGPAGENRVRFAAIMNSCAHAYGRGGAGAVMGSKHLKAIAVRGSRKVTLSNPKKFQEVALRTVSELANDTMSETCHAFGTSGSVEGVNQAHAFPAYNFTKSYSEDIDPLTGQNLVEKGYLKRRVACFGCTIGCHRFSEVEDGPYKGVHGGGPEYETMSALGAGCGVYKTDAVITAGELCNNLGMDTISAGSVIQWAMENFERGIMTTKDTKGLDLRFGNDEALIQVLADIAYRRTELGELLAEGAHRASRKLGKDSWKWAVTNSKGLEQSRVETRSAKAYALAFAVNPRGPDHLMTETVAEFGLTPEAIKLIERITGDRKMATSYATQCRAEIVRWHEDIYAATDSLGLCAFSTTASYAVNEFNMSEMVTAATGVEVTSSELMLAGRRIVTLERLFNVREGADRRLDDLPYRLMNEPLRSGPPKGFMNSRSELDEMLDRYYDLHGWDIRTSLPKKTTLRELDLQTEAEEVEKWVKLP
jgi:aldehyde:ferredoxin oxidoreductase